MRWWHRVGALSTLIIIGVLVRWCIYSVPRRSTHLRVSSRSILVGVARALSTAGVGIRALVQWGVGRVEVTLVGARCVELGMFSGVGRFGRDATKAQLLAFVVRCALHPVTGGVQRGTSLLIGESRVEGGVRIFDQWRLISERSRAGACLPREFRFLFLG